ncbi:type IV toxin-antitoxin system AbiEi family antitoxin domain-containing protein [Lentisalinibacter sediminis]|uniref:type IV toxin-antitoxin system AbiEi family antitoxin domain-containing protein n=1 Tax=Lentisalinibacter sediminis TaxID=2992237 RepID=UPI00386FAFBB
MMSERSYSFSSYLDRLLSKGRLVLTPERAQEDLGISRRAFIDAAKRQQNRGNLIMPRRGFYVIVPPQYLALGAPPPSFYIDSLMRHEGCPYYVGLLKAAEHHGATHQAVMQYQVITDKRLPNIRAGRSLIVFYYRKDMGEIAGGLQEYKTEAGFIKVSSPELTMLDLLRYRHATAGLDNIATVLSDLGPQIIPDKLASLAGAFERTVVQRLGYMLDDLGLADQAEPLHAILNETGPLPWTALEPIGARDRAAQRAFAERNERWHVTVSRVPEID